MISVPNTKTNFQNNVIVPTQNPSMNSGKLSMQEKELTQSEYQIPEDVLSVLPYFDGFTTKFYMYGFLNKKNELTPDGKLFKMRDWTRWYVELCGPVMIFWRATPEYDTNNIEKLKSLVSPNFLNVSDCIVSVSAEQDSRKYIFSLNTSGANRFYMEAGSQRELNDWVCAIRLSSYEMAKLHQMYTYVILTRPEYTSLFSTYNTLAEGSLQIKYAGTLQWKKCWAVLDNNHTTPQNDVKIQFYEDSHSGPLLTIRQVRQVYSVYPERPELSDVSGVFKVEGTIDINVAKDAVRPEFVIMSAETPEEMARWVVTIFDAYKLLGRPERLDIPPAPTDTHALFLDVPQINHLDMARNNSMDCKQLFENILMGDNDSLHEQMINMSIDNTPEVPRTATKSSVSFAPSTKKNGKKPKTILPSDSEESEEMVDIEESESDDDDGLFISAPIAQHHEKAGGSPKTKVIDSNIQPSSKTLKVEKQLVSDSEEESSDGELFTSAPKTQQHEETGSIVENESNSSKTESPSIKVPKTKKQLVSDSEEDTDEDGQFTNMRSTQHEIAETNNESKPANLESQSLSDGGFAPRVSKTKKQLASDSEEESDEDSHQSDEQTSSAQSPSFAIEPPEPESTPDPEAISTPSVPKARKLKAKAVLPSDTEESEHDEDDDPVFISENRTLQQQQPIIAFTAPENDMSRDIYHDPRFANSANQFPRPSSAMDPRPMSYNPMNTYAQDIGRRDQIGRQYLGSIAQSEYDPRYPGWEGVPGSSIYPRDPNLEAEERWRREEFERRRFDMGPPSPTLQPSMYGVEDEIPIGGFNPMDRRQLENQRLAAMRGNSMYSYSTPGNFGMPMGMSMDVPMNVPMNMSMNGGSGYYAGSTYMDDSGFDYHDPAFGYSPYQSRMEPMGLLAAHDAARLARFEQPRHGPLIQVHKKKVTHQVGLVGAIAAREQFKATHKYTNANSGSAMLELAREREEALEREKERMLVEQRQQVYYQEELRRRMGTAPGDRGFMYPSFVGAPPMNGMMRPGSSVYIPEGSDEEDNQTLVRPLPGQRYSSPHIPQQPQSFYGAPSNQHLSISPQYPSRLSAPLSNDISPISPGGHGRHSYMDPGALTPATRTVQNASTGYPANQRPASSFASTTSSSNVSPASSRNHIESASTGSQNSFAPPKLPENLTQPLGMSSLSSAVGINTSDDVEPSGSESEEENLPKSSSEISDKFEEFIDDKVEMKPYSFVDSQQLYDSYLSWCRVKRLPPNTQAGPGQMEALMFENGFTKKKKKDASPNEESEQWYNITII